jgi:hypothetical protein
VRRFSSSKCCSIEMTNPKRSVIVPPQTPSTRRKTALKYEKLEVLESYQSVEINQ